MEFGAPGAPRGVVCLPHFGQELGPGTAVSGARREPWLRTHVKTAPYAKSEDTRLGNYPNCASMIFNFDLDRPPSPGGSRGSRTVVFLGGYFALNHS